ncbi:MlaA family lipoprotein [Ponticoccus alexandrii]|uniref:VacJ family lipoprotein n=1 Tax=Ponticoccus alexandrii TaxID=1943633 RepID=A0ABX7F5L0_9RHOB|nr:VacJ family lipoprotein [Ponticoccus alexandrii]ETA52525.1 VacJ lipoprotein [Rhodobacteraceae bacterium PD-2]QRF65486.1 VacJ family lipoprotein [Ponticoccus alexandrii]
MRFDRVIWGVVMSGMVAGCSLPGPGDIPADGVYDPYEASNRRTHAFNRSVDERFLKGTGGGYARTVPGEVQQGISNFAETVSLPQTVVNQILQGRLGAASKNTLRFSANVLMGFGGLADVATEMGLPEDGTDFGETLSVWGVPEGAYLELPVLGPSTERDAIGRFADLFLDPVSYLVPAPERYIGTAARTLEMVGDRGQYSDTVDSVLYESADSYDQLKLIYMQNRRFELGQEAPGNEIDPTAIDVSGF